VICKGGIRLVEYLHRLGHQQTLEGAKDSRFFNVHDAARDTACRFFEPLLVVTPVRVTGRAEVSSILHYLTTNTQPGNPKSHFSSAECH
jgi:hypothetical protein